jgi:hypothetical protein
MSDQSAARLLDGILPTTSSLERAAAHEIINLVTPDKHNTARTKLDFDDC